MNPIISKEAIQELQKALVPVVEKLGQDGEWVYQVYYKQQIVYGILCLIPLVLFFAFTLIFFLCKRKAKFGEYSGNFENFEAVMTVIFGIFAFTAFILSLIALPEAIGHLINPDYYILQDLLSIIKK